MVTKTALDEFVQSKKLAVVGASRGGKKFGNAILNELNTRGYQVFAVHPTAEKLEGVPCHPSLAALPEKVDGVVVCVPPQQAEKVVREAVEAGIKRVWLQQGADSPAAIDFCQKNGVSLVYGECILMYVQPVKFPHAAHRWVWKLLGKVPA